MSEAFLIDLVRTPMGRGKMGASLSEIHPVDLGAIPVKALIERNKIDPKAVEDLIYGCVTPIGEQGMNIGRLIALMAIDESVPGIQINRMCSSGLQAVEFAKQAIMAGDADLLIAGGVEHMGRVPMGMDGLPLPMSPNQGTTLPESYLSKYSLKSMGQSGELIAEKWGFTRDELDEFAINSHKKAYAAQEAGYFKNEIIPVQTKSFGLVEKDEGIRESIDREKMKTLPTPFKDGGVVTAANASQITDGASAVLLASDKAVKKYNLKPRAKIIKTHVCAVDPVMQLTGPIPAIKGVLSKTGLKISDIDLFEINEAFASVVLSAQKELNIPLEKINVNGGAIALGHPLGCSGARILTTLVNELERRGLKRGLASMCVGFGHGIATIVELV
jgi:acetyl-CoA C-acetyltransferase